MNLKSILAIVLLSQVHLTFGQDLSVDDLIYFQTVKKSIMIDSVLQTKAKWDCSCLRQFDRMDLVTEWLYDIADSTKEYAEKDYIKSDEVGNGFSAVITYYTTDRQKADAMLSQMNTKKMTEEKEEHLRPDQLPLSDLFLWTEKWPFRQLLANTRLMGEVNMFSL